MRSDDLQQFQPIMYAHDFCGEHQPKETEQ